MNIIRSFLSKNCLKILKPNCIQFQRPLSGISPKNDATDGPIKFSASGAHKYQARVTRMGYEDTRLWYEPYVIIASIGVFLLYFTILREENDIDDELVRTLYSRIEGLEEHQLRATLEYNLDNALPTEDIVKRLKELDRERRATETDHNL